MEFDAESFEKDWVGLAEEVIRLAFENPEIQAIKKQVRGNAPISWELKNEFVTLFGQIKNKLISEKYGDPKSETYQNFVKQWQQWQSDRGSHWKKPKNVFEENIDHVIHGSTPVPEKFLRGFDLNKDIL